MTWLIIITGRPAAGKSTLATQLGEQLSLPVFGKDNIKEVLFEELGWQDREWSKLMGRASVELLYYIAKILLSSGQSLIVENAFHPELASPKLRSIIENTDARSLQIICDASPETLLQRFKQRHESGARHVGHVDDQSLDEFRTNLAQERPIQLDIPGIVLNVDTTDFATVDYKSILEQLVTIINNNE